MQLNKLFILTYEQIIFFSRAESEDWTLNHIKKLVILRVKKRFSLLFITVKKLFTY